MANSVSWLKFRPGEPDKVSLLRPSRLGPSLARTARHDTPMRGREEIGPVADDGGCIGQIYSSAYDGTLRVTRFETGMSEEVIDGERWEQDALIHSFDFDLSGNELWGTIRKPRLCFVLARPSGTDAFFLSQLRTTTAA